MREFDGRVAVVGGLPRPAVGVAISEQSRARRAKLRGNQLDEAGIGDHLPLVGLEKFQEDAMGHGLLSGLYRLFIISSANSLVFKRVPSFSRL